MRLETIPLDDITPPERSNKLHPYENEDDEDWAEFTESVGTEPQKPLEVTENGSGYELIDGDRRYRALTENGAETVNCFVVDNVESTSETDFEVEKTVRMVRANEHREDSDPKQRALATAKICAPYLLLPGERLSDERIMSQNKMAKEIGKSQPRLSVWLKTLKQERPLRDALGAKASGNYPDADAVRMIDKTIDLLRNGGDDGSTVIPIGQNGFVANEIGDMQGVNLSEIRNVAEKAANEGWNDNRFLKYLNKHYAHDPTSEEVQKDIEDGTIEEGMMDGSDLDFEDDSAAEASDIHDGAPETDEILDETDEVPKPEIEAGDIDWSDYVDDDDLTQSLSELETRRMITQSVEDEGAVAVHILCDITGMSQRDVMEAVVEPMLADFTASWLQENV